MRFFGACTKMTLNSFTKRRFPVFSLRSVFLTCMFLVTVSTAIVAGTLQYLSVRTERNIAIEATRNLGNDITGLMAETFSDALLFGKSHFVQKSLDHLLEVEGGRLSGALVVTNDGGVVAETGNTDNPNLLRLAETALASDVVEYTGDGLWIAVPIRNASQPAPIGVFAAVWSPEEIMAQIDERNIDQVRIATAVFVAVLIFSAISFKFAVSVPLRAVAARTVELGEGNYDRGVPGKKRFDEIGETARSLDELRAKLLAADAINRDAVFQSAGFQASSTALLMTDADLIITHENATLQQLFASNPDAFKAVLESDVKDGIVGKSVASIDISGTRIKTLIDENELPMRLDKVLNDRTFSIKINAVSSPDGDKVGYVFELEEVTQTRRNEAIISALEAGLMRADFDASGRLISGNTTLTISLPCLVECPEELEISSAASSDTSPIDLSSNVGHETLSDTFRLTDGEATRVVNGSISPIKNQHGANTGFVFLGNDITDAETARKNAEAETRELTESVLKVVDALRPALTNLSEGDLSMRITSAFSETHEPLRHQFNASLQSLDDAVSLVLVNAQSILGEVGSISVAADDLSKRTERQAATLEQFAAALSEITASVASAAEGANQANTAVLNARENAETSGQVVKEAVDAMGEIASSSQQISKITNVIDDIAFQTNLLALNAGVEAARAGEAGRGFAVVASEVRALAQRSSDAAREINALISTSGSHVDRGVALVDKAGEALSEIVQSIAGISGLVTQIATSAKEQSAGLEEINSSISQLDQVTQQNVAMFEEMTAASHTLKDEATALVGATGRFQTSSKSASIVPMPNNQLVSSSRIEVTELAPTGPSGVSASSALALENDDDLDDGWEDF